MDFFSLDSVDDIDGFIKDIQTPVKVTASAAVPAPSGNTVEVSGAKDLKKAGAEAALDVAATAGDVTRAMASGYEEIAKIQSASAGMSEKAAAAAGDEARKQALSLMVVKEAYNANVRKLDADINTPESLRNKAGDAFVEASVKKLEILKNLESTATRETTGVFDWLKRGFQVEALKEQAGAVDIRQQAAANIMSQQSALLTAEGNNLRQNTLAVDAESAGNASLIAAAVLQKQAYDSKAQAVGTGINMIQMGCKIVSQRAGLVLQAAQAIMTEEQFGMQKERFLAESSRLAQDERFSQQTYQLYLTGLRVSGADTSKALSMDKFKLYMTNKNPEVANFVSIGMLKEATGVERMAANPADAAVAIQQSGGAFTNNPTAKAYGEFVLQGAAAVAKRPNFAGVKPAEQQRQISNQIVQEFENAQNDADKSPLLKSPGPMLIGKAEEIQKDKWFQTIYGAAFAAGNAVEYTPSHLLNDTRAAILEGKLTPTEASEGIKKYFDQVGFQSDVNAIRFGLPKTKDYKVKLDRMIVNSTDRINFRSTKELDIEIARLVAAKELVGYNPNAPYNANVNYPE